jgi:hypothetical protein
MNEQVPHGVLNVVLPLPNSPLSKGLRCTHKSSRVAPQRLDPPNPP